MDGVAPLALNDFAVLGALTRSTVPLTVERVASAACLPSNGPGVTLSHDTVRRVLRRLNARGLVENRPNGGWQPTHRGRTLWAAKGRRFTL